MYSFTRWFSVFALFFVLVYVISCASPANKELADATSALQEAKEAGAEQYAPEEYAEVEELIRRAQELMEQGKHNEARELLEEARFKAIAAKGKAIENARMAEMSQADREIEAQFLSDIKPEIEAESVVATTQTTGLEDIFFDFDKADIRPDARITLKSNASHLKRNEAKYKVVVIEGYCDTRGTEEYNLALGQKRADATKSYLVGLGVSPSLLQAISKGETDQWASGTSEYAYQQNRRAHFVPVEK